jgi:hypothetical protein
MSSGIGFAFLFGLPVLIGQWVGVIALAKAGRNGAWWCMLTGTVLTTLGSIASILSLWFMIGGRGGSGSGGMDTVMVIMMVVSGAAGLGSLLFAIGFAMHGMRAKSMVQRIEELESVLAAQGEQLSRQHPGSGV